MKTCSFIVLTFIIQLNAFSQKDTVKSSYRDLPVKVFYSVKTTSATVDGKIVYRGNGKIISKEQFEKFNSYRKNLDECAPCILETYDENDKIVIRAAQYKDCCVGSWIGFYPNGKMKTIGHYRENETGIWDPLWDHGYCIKHGTWTELDKNGKPVKIEKYNYGSLVEEK
jgi:antitoxin component YwqK of YwqJK toxin-antitoxin module